MQLDDEPLRDPLPIEPSSVWRDADIVRFPHRRVQILETRQEAYQVVWQLIDTAGRPIPGFRFADSFALFAYGDRYIPDDTGLPITHYALAGQLRPLSELEEQPCETF